MKINLFKYFSWFKWKLFFCSFFDFRFSSIFFYKWAESIIVFFKKIEIFCSCLQNRIAVFYRNQLIIVSIMHFVWMWTWMSLFYFIFCWSFKLGRVLSLTFGNPNSASDSGTNAVITVTWYGYPTASLKLYPRVWCRPFSFSLYFLSLIMECFL